MLQYNNPSGKVMRDPQFSQQPVIAGIHHCSSSSFFSLSFLASKCPLSCSWSFAVSEEMGNNVPHYIFENQRPSSKGANTRTHNLFPGQRLYSQRPECVWNVFAWTHKTGQTPSQISPQNNLLCECV